MSVYNKLSEKKNFNPQINNIIDIFYNKHTQKGELRMKRNNKKIKNFLQNDIILNEDANIYIVILVNNHAIRCTDNYIFDTSFMTINVFETVIVYSKRHKNMKITRCL